MRELTLIRAWTLDHAREVLAGKRVCVTGGRGALGRHLTSALLESGARVFTLGRHAPLEADFDARSTLVRHVVGNILDPEALHAAFRGCSVVFHLAGIGAPGTREAPVVRTYKVNTQGTIQILSACVQAGVSRLVFASTALIYGMPRALPVTEDHPSSPRSAFATSKRAAEVALQGTAERLGVRCDIARLSEVYGASFDERTVVGAALMHMGLGRPIVIGPSGGVADYLHVDDAVGALMALACSDGDGAACRVVNVSSGQGTTTGELVGTLAQVAADSGLDRIAVVGQGPGLSVPAGEMVLDITLIKETTGWRPRLSLAEGLGRSVETWLRMNQRVLS